MVTRFRLIIRYAALLTLLGGAPAVAATVSVTVTGAADERGQIIACLWRDGSNFPDCNRAKLGNLPVGQQRRLQHCDKTPLRLPSKTV